MELLPEGGEKCAESRKSCSSGDLLHRQIPGVEKVARLLQTELQKKLFGRTLQISHEQLVERRFGKIEFLRQFLNLDGGGGIFLELIHDGDQFGVVGRCEVGAFPFPDDRIRIDVNHFGGFHFSRKKSIQFFSGPAAKLVKSGINAR